MMALLLHVALLHAVIALDNDYLPVFIPPTKWTCAKDRHFRFGCTRRQPCSREQCQELCDRDTNCNYYWSNSAKCKLFGSCDNKVRSRKEIGVTYRKNCDHDGFGRCGCDSQVASNTTTGRWAGGTLYVHDPASGNWEWAHIVDLGDAAVKAGCTPRHKPHMILPSPDGRYVAVSYTGDKFVHVLNAYTKQIVICVDARHPAAGVVGGAIHTGAWYGTDRFVMVDMTGSINGVPGGALHKFHLDFANGASYHEGSLAIGPTKTERGTGATKPIAMGTNPLGAYGHLYFVTDAKGAASIVDVRGRMSISKNLPLVDFAPCVGGGLWTQPHPEDPEVLIAQYGSQGGAECLFQVNLKDQAITKTYSLPRSADDAHGIQFCKSSTGMYYLVNSNRASATLDVLEYDSGDLVVAGWDMNAHFDREVLQPDVIYLRENSELYIAARGPSPVSAVKPQNFFPDATPGLFKLSLTDCIAPTFNTKDAFLPTEQGRVTPDITSDVHSVWGVNDEIWIIDQAATGSVQTYEVFSKCAAYTS